VSLAATLFLAIGLALPAQARPVAAPAQEAKSFEGKITITAKMNYLLSLPADYGKSRKSWPLVLFLHGSGECGMDGEKQTHVGFGPALVAHPERWPFVVVFPQKPAEDPEWEECESIVFRVLADATRRYGIDEKRVALAGMSQGGHGTWFIGARHPERWTCLVPICGYGRPRNIQRRAMRLPGASRT